MLLDNELKVGIKEMLIKLNTDLASGLPKAVTQIDGSFTLVNLFAQKAPGEYRIEARFEGNHLYDPCYSERKVIIFEKKNMPIETVESEHSPGLIRPDKPFSNEKAIRKILRF
jgi:hypothetical protein